MSSTREELAGQIPITATAGVIWSRADRGVGRASSVASTLWVECKIGSGLRLSYQDIITCIFFTSFVISHHNIKYFKFMMRNCCEKLLSLSVLK